MITATKISCLLVPALQLGLLRVPAIRDSDLANLMVMNVIGMCSWFWYMFWCTDYDTSVLINMGMSSVFLLLTLLYIISIHRETRGATEVRLSRTYDGVVEFRPKSQIASLLEKGNDDQVYMNNKGIAAFGLASDGWIIGRIALAFFMVECVHVPFCKRVQLTSNNRRGLQVYVIVMQIFFLNRWAHFKLEWQQGLSAPVIDQAEEFANICSPIPSSFTGFLFLLVFGTTREARNQSMTLIKDTWNVLMFRPKQRVPSARYPVDLERARLRKQRSGSITNRMYGITESHTSIMSGLSETPRSSVADSLNAPTMLSPTIFLGGTIYQDRHRVYGPRIVTELEPGTTGASGRYTKSPIRTTTEHVQTNFSSCRPSSESEAKGAGDNEIPIGVAVSSPSPRLIVRRYPDSPWSVETSLVISPKPIARMGNFEVIRHVSAGGSSGEGGVENRGN